ncbi:4Fe-4S ferredoxin [Desulfuromonas versatilis]|uniref:4Fe-4S ferredoxin n=2 Tax=Desulfuromonas versatilis TaxID=2802975 RepID=A0ABM8HX90_9BACT|nr:4Fe-4S ferredoxin [Desulfuromonas versatilis]
MKIVVDPQTCTGCGACIEVCPAAAISLEQNVAVIDPLRCDLDGICIPACPVDAISFQETA